jgi:23S rRNA pseudouridine1911/1915/1917 synthase
MGDAFEVPDALSGERIDRAVALATGWSRAEVQALLADELVLVAGAPAAKSRRVRAGETVELLAAPPPAQPPGAEPVPVEIRYADADVIVVAKPAGLVVHPGAGHPGGTLVNGLLREFPDLAGVGDPHRPGIVHRLDRDTSGLMVVARSPQAFEGLVAQLAARAVERVYDALAWGTFATTAGLIDAPIARSPRRRTRMAVRDDGRDARTTYRVTRTWSRPEVSLLECRLETGRTHQIRVHLAAIGHPVVGDATYRGFRENLPLRRPFLHARRLAFRHPASGEEVALDEPLPTDLARILEQLG